MNAKKGTPEGAPVNIKRCKDTHYNQLCKTKSAFFDKPRTMMAVAKQVGIDRANVCWYVRDLRKHDAIWLVRKGTCPITKWDDVGYYSTNPKYAENLPKQLTLF